MKNTNQVVVGLVRWIRCPSTPNLELLFLSYSQAIKHISASANCIEYSPNYKPCYYYQYNTNNQFQTSFTESIGIFRSHVSSKHCSRTHCDHHQKVNISVN